MAYVGVWKMNEASGDRTDFSGNGNTLTTEGSPPGVPGKAGNAVSFNGTDQCLKIADASQTGLDPGGSFTITFWGNFTAPASGVAPNHISKDKLGSRQLECGQYPIDNATDGRKLYFYLNATSVVKTTSALTNGLWYYVSYVYKYVASGTSEMRTYVNGVLFCTPVTNAVGPPTNSTGDFQIGAREFVGNRNFANCKIDDVRYDGSSDWNAQKIKTQYMVLRGIF